MVLNRVVANRVTVRSILLFSFRFCARTVGRRDTKYRIVHV